MKLNKTVLVVAAGLVFSSAAAQQLSRSGYFMDGYSYRHELNPAFLGERNYISLPALGNLNLGAYSNVGIKTFLYEMPAGSKYKYTTFMSPTVSADEFLGKLGDKTRINYGVDLTVLSAGFKAFNGFNTITIGVHTYGGVTLPKDFFRFMKQGQTSDDTRYSIQDLGVQASAYAEVALGHGHAINDRLNIGAKVKVLLGAGNVSADVSDMQIRMSDNQWHITAQGELMGSAGSGLRVPTKRETGAEYNKPSEADLIDWGAIDYDKFGIAGFGLGVDLGATYQLTPDLQLSAAVTDLGFMNWKHAVKGETGKGEWTFDGFDNIAIDSSQPGYEDNKIEEQFDNMWNDIQDVVNFHRTQTGGTYTKALHATMRVGAEYIMPFYRGLSGGMLFTHCFGGLTSWTEGRLYANVKPASWFDCSVNGGYSTYGSSFGWIINFHPRGLNFFIGSDHQVFKVNKQCIPMGNATANVTLGINVTFGG